MIELYFTFAVIREILGWIILGFVVFMIISLDLILKKHKKEQNKKNEKE